MTLVWQFGSKCGSFGYYRSRLYGSKILAKLAYNNLEGTLPATELMVVEPEGSILGLLGHG